MFKKVLIANRGEIACRVARTARRMGIAVVAVYSEADAKALHVALADEACLLGPAEARESYLRIDKIINAAKLSGAEAVHPGYGFLSENADFAQACADAGLTFIGPPPQAMRLMGSKAAAKALMARAGAPILPGYHDAAASGADYETAAARIGYPLLVKASAGGGGRGMRLVRETAELAPALESAAREAQAAFGDGGLLLEKYLERPRHVEVQIFADACGAVVAFPERDCSLQRRHQKIIEETPAAGLDEAIRLGLSQAAVLAASASGYVGAGTVEFLYQDGAYYFLEMNARLQVEHPVTELVAGLDLVEWQFRIAAGEPLPLRQEDIIARGCAIEARMCAEDAARDFLPSAGAVAHLKTPCENAHVRVDAGVRLGDRVTPHYDSLLAKLIVWGEDRDDAVRRLQRALQECELVGVATNLDFLRALTRQEDFVAGGCDTGFIARRSADLLTPAPPTQSQTMIVLAAAAAAWIATVREREREAARRGGDPWSPWAEADAWRAHGEGGCDIHFRFEDATIRLRAQPRVDGGFRLETPNGVVQVSFAQDGEAMELCIDGVKRRLSVVRLSAACVVVLDGRNFRLDAPDPLAPPAQSSVDERRLTAPMTAKVTRILAKEGETVRKGAPLLVLEAMKMEATLTAPRDATVERLRCSEGDTAQEGLELVVLSEEARL